MDYIDMLARFGVGDAHPGGFTSTLKQLKQLPLPPGGKLLEVGCGTGRTACYLAQTGYDVTGVDMHPGMLAKARSRAEQEGVNVQWLQADICSLPVADNTFDIVFAESVTIFSDPIRAYGEYFRVLRPGGLVYDREIMAAKPCADEIKADIYAMFGVSRLPDRSEWIKAIVQAGFENVQVWSPGMLAESNDRFSQVLDPLQRADDNIYDDQAVWNMVRTYDDTISKHAEYLGYGVWVARKPGD